MALAQAKTSTTIRSGLFESRTEGYFGAALVEASCHSRCLVAARIQRLPILDPELYNNASHDHAHLYPTQSSFRHSQNLLPARHSYPTNPSWCSADCNQPDCWDYAYLVSPRGIHSAVLLEYANEKHLETKASPSTLQLLIINAEISGQENKVMAAIEEKGIAPKTDLARPQHTHTITPNTTPPRTPTALASSVHELFHEIRDIYNKVSTLPSLAPGEQINQLLTRLVSLCIISYSAEFTRCFFDIDGVADLCKRLRPICAAAEGELEKHWAKRIISKAYASMLTIHIYVHHMTNRAQQQIPDQSY